MAYHVKDSMTKIDLLRLVKDSMKRRVLVWSIVSNAKNNCTFDVRSNTYSKDQFDGPILNIILLYQIYLYLFLFSIKILQLQFNLFIG